MATFVKTISTELDNLKRRVVKVLRYGNSDVQTADEVSPFGIDSNPLKDMMAIYSTTDRKGDTIIVGYINKDQIAAPGETRLFSKNTNGELQSYLWLKNNGVMEIGGDTDFMVRYSKLEEAFNELKDKFNSFANSYVPGGPSAQGLPAVVQPSNADITQAKIEDIKTR